MIGPVRPEHRTTRSSCVGRSPALSERAPARAGYPLYGPAPGGARGNVLVATASRHGSTAEISRAIGQVLRGYQVPVDTLRADGVPGLRGYGAVVLGSAVYQGAWTDAARIFVVQHEQVLRSVPLWLFSSGPVGGCWYDELPGEAADLQRRLGAISHRLFSGRLDRGLLSAPERAALTVRPPGSPAGGSVAGRRAGPPRRRNAPPGQAGEPRWADDRDWGAVRGWARGIAEMLTDPDRWADALRDA
ncbi:MAG: menaquinone-dependent protoporphyrinogen oxidase [Actinomycetota bacterium]|nr:menaquinone-dependent protoporphyrinogen oxidase [Actinomycetota bacterium]